MTDGPVHTMHHSIAPPADAQELPRAVPPAVVDVPPGEAFDLTVGPVGKQVGELTLPMLSYGGSIPGPTLRVRQGSRIEVNVTNETRMDTTVHWHGLRLENRYDGVPNETQEPIAPGGRYTHGLTFPDAGLFWYHPHVREDFAQELGLYGNVIVDPADPGHWPPADRDVVLTLDDVLIEDGRIAAYEPHGPNFVAMGRFGNVLLTGGETAPRVEVRAREVVRLYLTNTANTRVFKVALPGARTKLVGGDAGRYEREQWVDVVVIAPSERAILDVSFDEPGAFELQHLTPARTYTLARVIASHGEPTAAAGVFRSLRVNEDMVAERRRIASYLDAPPDKTLALIAEMDVGEPEAGAAAYTCPMHPDVVSVEPGHCPKCGMKLVPSGADGDMPAHGQHDHPAESTDGIEWEDLMPDVNRASTAANMLWKLVDRDTGAAGGAIDWTFDAGDQVKIRLVNEMESDHPMHHPFHVHGERFLVLARDGVVQPNLVWKDTVLLRTGEVVDVLMDASNPGLWMMHCHIAEHMESGMMLSFRVRAPQS